jgi:hypothetical protein
MEVFWMVWRSDEVTVEAAMFAGLLIATKLGDLFRFDTEDASDGVIDLDRKIGDR